MNRIDERFKELRAAGGKALVCLMNNGAAHKALTISVRALGKEPRAVVNCGVSVKSDGKYLSIGMAPRAYAVFNI